MRQYFGTKRIAAKPMNRQDYNDLRGWKLPADENGADEGYLVEYLDGGKPNLEGYKGYVSWSPKEQFEKAYQPIDQMSFGHALAAMNEGHKVARAGWNGKGMWITLGQGFNGLKAENFWNKHTREFAEKNGGKADVLPYFIMKTADNKILMGWLASQTDMIATDWGIV